MAEPLTEGEERAWRNGAGFGRERIIATLDTARAQTISDCNVLNQEIDSLLAALDEATRAALIYKRERKAAHARVRVLTDALREAVGLREEMPDHGPWAIEWAIKHKHDPVWGRIRAALSAEPKEDDRG